MQDSNEDCCQSAIISFIFCVSDFELGVRKMLVVHNIFPTQSTRERVGETKQIAKRELPVQIGSILFVLLAFTNNAVISGRLSFVALREKTTTFRLRNAIQTGVGLQMI
jgi:hypothetical protein